MSELVLGVSLEPSLDTAADRAVAVTGDHAAAKSLATRHQDHAAKKSLQPSAPG